MDSIRATPYEYELLGLLADKLKKAQDYATSAYGEFGVDVNPALNLLGIPAVQQTMERVAYGEPLTTGKGMTTQVRPEVMEAAMTLLPAAGKAAQVAERGAMAAGRAGERFAERVVPQIMERGGMPAGLLEGMSSRTVSPLTVYHGSPAKFERFDPTKIGSGEGAQAYGYGHYVAESPETANQYKEMLKSKAFSKIVQRDRNVYDVVAPDGTVVSQGTLLGQAHKAKDAYDANVGSVYTIDLPDEQIAKMLDWDKPISQQKDVMAALNSVAEKNVKAKVRNDIENEIRASGVLPTDKTGDDYMSLLFGQSDETLAKADQMLKDMADKQMAKIDFAPLIKNELEGMKPATMTWDATGREFYQMLSQRSGSPEKASALFKEQGVPGIRYLDQGSRTPGGSDTSNFVVFPGNEGLLTIQKRNNEVIAPTSLLDKSPQSEALLIAQRNAAKPIEEGGLGLPPDNTAMDRAKALGFRTKDKLYHGTPEQDIKEFVPTPHDETSILGTSLTSDPSIAEFYAKGRGFSEQEGANILPVMIRGKKPQDFEKFTDYLINKNLLGDRTRKLTPEAKKYLESKGISGFDMSSLYGDEVQVVDPSRIRSVFAAFDPARRNEADILAGVLPLSLLADEENRKKTDSYFRSLLGQ